MSSIDQMLRRVTEAFTHSMAAQQEAFLARHIDLIGTHYLAHWPTEYEGTISFVVRQFVALLPEGTPEPISRGDAEKHPHTVLQVRVLDREHPQEGGGE